MWGFMVIDNFFYEDFCYGFGFDIWYGEGFCLFCIYIYED